MDKQSVSIDQDKIEYDSRFDGKWVLLTNTGFSAEEVALKYKELWQVERPSGTSSPSWRPGPYITTGGEHPGACVLQLSGPGAQKELERRLEEADYCFEWADIKRDLKALQEVIIEDHGKSLALRTHAGTCGKVFQAVAVAIPPTIRAA